jgi:hypothetical protein
MVCDYLADLLDLVGFGHGVLRLQIDDLIDTLPGKCVMVSTYQFFEPKPQQ